MEWNYIDDVTKKQYDNLTISDLQEKIIAGTFIPTKKTKFWNEDEWVTLAVLPELLTILIAPVKVQTVLRRKSTTALSCKRPFCTQTHRNLDGFCHLHRNLAAGKKSKKAKERRQSSGQRLFRAAVKEGSRRASVATTTRDAFFTGGGLKLHAQKKNSKATPKFQKKKKKKKKTNGRKNRRKNRRDSLKILKKNVDKVKKTFGQLRTRRHLVNRPFRFHRSKEPESEPAPETGKVKVFKPVRTNSFIANAIKQAELAKKNRAEQQIFKPPPPPGCGNDDTSVLDLLFAPRVTRVTLFVFTGSNNADQATQHTQRRLSLSDMLDSHMVGAGQKYEVVDVDALSRSALLKLSGSWIYPQLFIDNQYAGGFEECNELNEDGEFHEMLHWKLSSPPNQTFSEVLAGISADGRDSPKSEADSVIDAFYDAKYGEESSEESEESSEESEESTDDEMWGEDEEEWERTTLGGHQYGSKGTYKKTNKKWKFPTWKREKGDKKEKRANSDEWTVWKIILARFSKLTREKGDKKEKRANSDEWTVW